MIDELDDRIVGLMRQLVARTPTPPDLTAPVAEAIFSDGEHRNGAIVEDAGGATGVVVPLTSRRTLRAVAILVAAAACLIGLVVLTNRPTRTIPVSPPTPPTWATVPDPTGTFRAPTGAEVTSPGPDEAPVSPNGITLSDVAMTSLGMFAVGSEQSAHTSVAAVWRSPDGSSWSRIPHDPTVFGALQSARDPSTTEGYGMNQIVEFGGILVAVGGRFESHVLQPGEPGYPGSASTSSPVVWTSGDGERWSTQTLPLPDGISSTVMAVAAGTNGLMAVGSTYQVDTKTVVAEAWYSPDGTTWSLESVPQASGHAYDGLSANAIAAYGNDFIVAGSDNGRATSWISHDGSSWSAARLPDGIEDDSEVSSVRSLATSNGHLVALGWIRSPETVGVGSSSDTGLAESTGHSAIAVWYSDDGSVWTRATVRGLADDQFAYVGPLAGGPSGFVGATRLFVEHRFVEATISSTDGETWAIAPSALQGPRSAVAATPAGWVAVGSEVDYITPGQGVDPARVPENASVWIAAD